MLISNLCGPTFRWVHVCTHTACIPWWQAAHSVDVETLQVETAEDLVLLSDALHVGGGVNRLHTGDVVESLYGPVHFSGRRG